MKSFFLLPLCGFLASAAPVSDTLAPRAGEQDTFNDVLEIIMGRKSCAPVAAIFARGTFDSGYLNPSTSLNRAELYLEMSEFGWDLFSSTKFEQKFQTQHSRVWIRVRTKPILKDTWNSTSILPRKKSLPMLPYPCNERSINTPRHAQIQQL